MKPHDPMTYLEGIHVLIGLIVHMPQASLMSLLMGQAFGLTQV